MRNFSRVLLASCFIASAFVASAGPSDTVYATKQGKSYHKKNCSLKQGSHGMKLSEALKKGLKACKVCKPATK